MDQPKEDQRTFEFVISDETRDRHGTVLKMSGWDLENYRKNPVVAYQHELGAGFLSDRTDPDQIIGTSELRIEDNQLIAAVTFEPAEVNPFAEKIRQKVIHGTLRAASVGFDPVSGNWGDETRGEDPETFYFTRHELIEWSIVNVPSNPNATKRNMSVLNEFSDFIQKPKTENVVLNPKRTTARHFLNKESIK